MLITLLIVFSLVFLAFSWRCRNRALARATDVISEWQGRLESAEAFASRVEATSDLDDRVGSSRALATLQRLTTIAPLFGVIITAIELIRLDTVNQDITLLTKMQPLFGGVLVGAVLSVINQFIVVGCIGRIQTARASAVDGIRKEDFAESGDPTKVAGRDLVRGARALRIALDDLTARSQELGEVQNVIIETGTAAVGRLAEDCDAAGERLASLSLPRSEQIEAASSRLSDAIDAMSGGLETANSVLTTQVETQYRLLDESRDKNDERRDAEAEAFKNAMSESAKRLVDAASGAAKRMEGALDRMHDRIEKRMEDGAGRFTETLASSAKTEAERFKDQSKQLDEAMRGMLKTSEGLDRLATSLNEASNRFETGAHNIESQTKIAAQLATASAGVAKATNELEVAIQSLKSDGIGPLTSSATGLAASAAKVGPSLDQLGRAPEGLNKVMQRIVKSNEETTAAVGRIDASLARLATTNESIEKKSKTGFLGLGGRK